MDFSFAQKMLSSITRQDIFILGAALCEFIFFCFVLRNSGDINVHKSEMHTNQKWAEVLRKRLNFWYSIFTTLITLFPLFGMFGTVVALLNLDLSSNGNEMVSIQNNFFNALTSTAWGIVFSIVYKCLNSVIASRVNDTIDQIHEIVKNNKKVENNDS